MPKPNPISTRISIEDSTTPLPNSTQHTISTVRKQGILALKLIGEKKKSSRPRRGQLASGPGKRALLAKAGKASSTQTASRRYFPSRAFYAPQANIRNGCRPMDLLNQPNGAGGFTISSLAQALAGQVASLLKEELGRIGGTTIQPMLLDVKQAAIYLARTETAVQHLIASKVLPVVRHGRRVHLHRLDLDAWIEQDKS